MKNLLLSVLPVISVSTFVFFILYLIYEIFSKPKPISRKRSNVLFNASVTDNGTPANEVFETLEKNGIKINYLSS